MSDDKQQVLNNFTRIEKSNNLCTEVSLKETCDQDVLSFGMEGSKLRQQVQLFWNNVKRQSIRSYVRRLERGGRHWDWRRDSTRAETTRHRTITIHTLGFI
jgi:hypothetical protein